MDLRPTLTVRDCMDYLGLSKATVERRIRSGELKSYKSGRSRKIKREWLLEYEQHLIKQAQ